MSGAVSIVSLLGLLAWIFCVVDTLRRQRAYFWILLLLFFPVLVVPIYLVNFYLLDWAGWRRLDVVLRDRRRIGQLERELQAADIPGKREELALLYLDQRRFEDCLRVLAPALERDPENLRGQYCAGVAYLALGRDREAAAHLQYIQEVEPYYRSGEALLRLAEVLERLDRKPDAILTLEKLLQRYPVAEGVVRYARLLVERGYRDVARTELERLLRESAAAPGFHSHRERTWLRQARDLLKTL
jgi:hypothetical protein